MDDLKFNKVAAGFLMAGLIAMGGYKISEILVPHQKLAENSYPIEITQQVASSSSAAAPAGPEPILAMLADADIAAGQKVAKKCTACHVFDKGGQNKVGPALWNIVNAGKGQIDGYGYSEASGWIWRRMGLSVTESVLLQAESLYLRYKDEFCRLEEASRQSQSDCLSA